MESSDKCPTLPKYLVLDGGLGTEITKRCGNFYKDRLWAARVSHTEPQVVYDIQREFLEAGADLIMTNTFRPGVEFVMNCLSITEEPAREFLRNLARSTCAVRDKFWNEIKDTEPKRLKPLVAASMGPYGAGTPQGTDYAGHYIGKVSKKEMADQLSDKAGLLLEGGVDILGFEAIPAAQEAEAICELMKGFPGAKAWIAFCCKDGEHVCHGETFQEAVKTTLASDAVFGVGVNCSDPEFVTSLLKQIPDEVKQKKTIVVYPNNGLQFDTTEKKWIGSEHAKPIHEYVANWLDLGANWIGGCCHVNAQDISDITKAFHNHLKI